MLVYVESNFILEAAREQEENEFIQELISLAETKQIKLKFPVFALLEPYWTITKDEKTRKNLLNSLSQSFKEYKRSTLHKDLVTNVEALPLQLTNTANRERTSLETTIQRLIAVGEGIDINTAIYQTALSYRDQYEFRDFQDAVMYSAIISDLKQQEVNEPKCFTSRDDQAFGKDNPHRREIKAELDQYGCQFKFLFKNALSFVKSSLNLS